MFKRLIPSGLRKFIRRTQAGITGGTRSLYYQLFRRVNASLLNTPHPKLNIGCGPLVKAQWVNLDIEPVSGAYYFNAEKPLPFSEAKVRHIHCEHFLEHLEYSNAIEFLTECYRVLEPKGSLRIIVPDAEIYFQAYCRNDVEFFEKTKHLGGAVVAFKSRMEVINQMFRMGGAHRFAWDVETLEMNLKAIGFEGIQKSAFGDIPTEFNIDGTDEWRMLESLYVNARKP